MKGPAILVVDDDRDVLEMAECFFSEAGMEVCCTESGQQALEKIPERVWAVMITDYNMPGMNGLQLAEKALEIDPSLQVVMVTGHPSQALSDQAAGAGIAKVFDKPLQMEKVLGLIKEMIPATSS